MRKAGMNAERYLLSVEQGNGKLKKIDSNLLFPEVFIFY